MSDDDIEEPRGGTPVPRPKRKKRRAPIEALAAPPPPPAASGFSGGHLAGALVAGLVIGAMGGWGFRGSSAADPAVGKDAPAAGAAVSGRPSAVANRPQPPPEPTGPVYIALADYSPREGPPNAKVTIVEFSDFQ